MGAMARIQGPFSRCARGIFLLAATLGGAGVAHASVTISSAATQNMSCSDGVCTPTAANAVLNVGDLTTMLGSGNVTVNTATGLLAQQVEDIAVAAPFNWANASSLTLDAYRSVTVTASVAVNGSAPISLTTNDGGTGGYLSFVSGGSLSFLGTANGLKINGMAYALENSIAALAAAIAHKSSGRYALSASYDASHDARYKASPIPTKFKGTFNGLGNTISNLTVKSGAKNLDTGLFAYVNAGGSINSVRVTAANIAAIGHTDQEFSYAGVIVGRSDGTVFNSFASGQITANATYSAMAVGGLVGANSKEILDSAASTTVLVSGNGSPQPVEVGGLAGAVGGTLDNSYATGTVSAEGGAEPTGMGGLVGFNDGLTENCYAQGSATMSTGLSVGGLVGLTYSSVANSYSTGAAAGGSGVYVGGMLGDDQKQMDEGTLSNTYWDTTTSGITNLSQGAGNIVNDPGITGQTTAQLEANLPAGFDPTIWAESPSINNGLPYLIANPPQ
jgi:hypothetical protein